MTDDGAGYRNMLAAWSYDGSKIVYVHQPPNASPQVWTMNADGSDKQQLLSETISGTLPIFSPDASNILFDGLTADIAELWLMDADGTDPHAITQTTVSEVTRTGLSIQWSTNGAYSPDGTRIAYASTDSGLSEIWVMNADGSDKTQLTFPDDPNAPDSNDPSWSPDGSKLVFWSGFAREYGNIYTMNADGSDRTQLTFEPAGRNSDNPAWSPDGKLIMFESPRDGTLKTWIMAADGTNPRVLFSGGYGGGRLPINAGDETIWGAAGDKITGGTGATLIDGSAGQQTITGGPGQSMIIGGAGDVIIGSTGVGTSAISGAPGDAIIGGFGWDWIDGSAGSQMISGGPGHSTIKGGFGEVIIGSSGSGSSSIVGVKGDAIMAGSGNDSIDGRSGGQPITGGTGNTTVWGGAGDTVYGAAGNLTVNIDHSQFTGAVTIKDTGIKGYNTVVGFDQPAGDRLSFINETVVAIDNVLSSAQINNGNTILTLSDGSTVTLIGIAHIDRTFFA